MDRTAKKECVGESMETMRKLRFSLLQMNVAAGDPQRNFKKAESMFRTAMSASVKPDLLVLPEMWNTGYALDRIGELADWQGERTKALIGGLCREYGVWAVAGSIAEKTETGVRNTSYVFDRSGNKVSGYSKLHLFGLMEEDRVLTAGDSCGVTELADVPAGVMICYDIRFPELARSLALSGARLLIVPAEWPHPRLHHWRTLLMARAIENQAYVAACNRVGEDGTGHFFGHSMMIDPWGSVAAEAGEEETVLAAEADMDIVDEVRSRIPVFKDRRPTLYRLD